MGIKYNKTKGRLFQKLIKSLLLLKFENLLLEDLKVAVMGLTGLDIHMSPLARRIIPYSFLCKRVLSLNIYKAILQAKNNTKPGVTPAVVFRKNRMLEWIAIPLLKFLLLIGDIPNAQKN